MRACVRVCVVHTCVGVCVMDVMRKALNEVLRIPGFSVLFVLYLSIDPIVFVLSALGSRDTCKPAKSKLYLVFFFTFIRLRFFGGSSVRCFHELRKPLTSSLRASIYRNRCYR